MSILRRSLPHLTSRGIRLIVVLILLAGLGVVPAALLHPAGGAVRPAAGRVQPALLHPTAADWLPGALLVHVWDGGLSAPAGASGPLRVTDTALARVLAAWHLTRGQALDAAGGLYRLYAAGPGLDVAAAVRALAGAPGVAYAEPDYRLQAAIVPNDPYYGQQWYLNKIQAPAAWDITTGSPGIIVAMLDTGIAPHHPDLADKLVAGHNFVGNNSNTADDNGHGTHTAGVVAADGNNAVGIAGVAWSARLMPVKILDADGGGDVGNFAQGMIFATDHGARVINISAGVPYSTETMHDAVRYARSHGVLVVASAGNTPDGNPRYPAGYDEVVAVGATNDRDISTTFTSYGSYVDLSAPGVDIISTSWVNGRPSYDAESGTSFSAPMVSGAAALLLSVRPDLGPDQLQAILEGSSDDLGDPGKDTFYGAGRLNLLRALEMAQGKIPMTTPVPAGGPPAPTAVPAPPAAGLALNPTHGQPGDQVIVSGRGFTPGEAVALRLTGADGRARDLGSAQAGADGTFHQAVQVPADAGPGPATLVAVGAQSNAPQSALFAVDAGAGGAPGAGNSGAPPADAATAFARIADPAQPGVSYFPPVGHTLRGPFLAYWQAHGGLPIFGYPISEEFVEVSTTDGKPYRVQYFQRNRFEEHPDFAGTPNEVLLGLLGRDVTAGRVFPPGAPSAGDAAHVYFPPTGHLLTGAFLTYWQSHGGLAVFGYPISEAFAEGGFTVQYFERNRFEYHPEYAGTPNAVLLGLLGVDVARAKQFIP